jgi:hypothetical protein
MGERAGNAMGERAGNAMGERLAAAKPVSQWIATERGNAGCMQFVMHGTMSFRINVRAASERMHM